MTPRGTLYGVAVLAAALVIISGTIAAFNYYQSTATASENSQLVRELDRAGANYTALATNYNLLLARYNESISLLTRSISVLNTSQPVYIQASSELASLWQTYLRLKPASASLLQNSVMIDYGNGTRVWFNDTAVQAGWNLYIETVVLTNGHVTAVWYPQYGSHFVTAIGSVANSQTRFWFLWTYDRTASWRVAQVGADGLLATSGSVYAWTYCGADQNYNPTCKP